ncbi:MAG: glycosyltransferase family 1 protein [Planctomycetota bacterium]
MKIAIDGLLLFKPYTGLQHTLIRHIQALTQFSATGASGSNAPDGLRIRLFVPFDMPATTTFSDSVDVYKSRFAGDRRIRRALFRNFSMVRESYAFGAELFHGHSYYLPAWMSLPSVVTVHDVIPLTHPQCVSASARAFFKRSLPRTLKRAGRIITPTDSVKRDLIRLFNVEDDRIDVVHWFVESPPEISETVKKKMRREMNLPDQYILFIGRLEKKKNLTTLIRAFWSTHITEPIEQRLLIVGPTGNAASEIEQTIIEHRAQDCISFTGYLPDDAVSLVCQLADAVVLPSIAEGFGLPVIEAFAAGVPVLCSDIPVLREVGGDAARYAAADDVKAWRLLLTEVCRDSQARRQMADASRARASMFNNPRRYVDEINTVYQKALER